MIVDQTIKPMSGNVVHRLMDRACVFPPCQSQYSTFQKLTSDSPRRVRSGPKIAASGGAPW
jgi:hypothetical protein